MILFSPSTVHLLKASVTLLSTARSTRFDNWLEQHKLRFRRERLPPVFDKLSWSATKALNNAPPRRPSPLKVTQTGDDGNGVIRQDLQPVLISSYRHLLLLYLAIRCAEPKLCMKRLISVN